MSTLGSNYKCCSDEPWPRIRDFHNLMTSEWTVICERGMCEIRLVTSDMSIQVENRYKYKTVVIWKEWQVTLRCEPLVVLAACFLNTSVRM